MYNLSRTQILRMIMLFRGLGLIVAMLLNGCTSSSLSEEEYKALYKEYLGKRNIVFDLDPQLFHRNAEELDPYKLVTTASFRACHELREDPTYEQFNISCHQNGRLNYSIGPFKKHHLDYSFSDDKTTLDAYQNPYVVKQHVPYFFEKLPEILTFTTAYGEKLQRYTIENAQHWDDFLQTDLGRKRKIVEFYANHGVTVFPEKFTTVNEPGTISAESSYLRDELQWRYQKQVKAGGQFSYDKLIDEMNAVYVKYLTTKHDDLCGDHTNQSCSWESSSNQEKGYYFTVNQTQSQQLMITRTHRSHCDTYSMGVTFSQNVEKDADKTVNCDVKIDGKSVAKGACQVTEKSDLNHVFVTMEGSLINIEDLKVSPKATITYGVGDGSIVLTYRADDLKTRVTTLTQFCDQGKNI